MDIGTERGRNQDPAAPARWRVTARPGDPERLRAFLAELFPPAPAPTPTATPKPKPKPTAIALSVLVQCVLVVAGAWVLLERIPGRPAWSTVYGEDYWEFLLQAIQYPWHLFIPYNGYEQLVPRLVAQFARYLPITEASRLFAVTGAVIAAACGLFVYHATAGHIRSTSLRVLLGAAVVLLPGAPMEIADSVTNTLWYLLIAAFWALLWRPRTRGGTFAAALVAFAAAASNIMVVLLAPLIAMRMFVLRRPREHVASAGWLAGCLIQVPGVLARHDARLSGTPATPHQALAFYAHEVVLPSLGWHFSLRLQALAGKMTATLIVAVIVTTVFAAIMVSQAANRPFAITAAVAGFGFPVFSVLVNRHVIPAARAALPWMEPAARYTALPIFLIECTAVLGADYLLRKRTARGARRPQAVTVAAILVVVLGTGWLADFRYPGYRSNAAWDWAPIAAKWQRDCQRSGASKVREWVPVSFQVLPCGNMRL